MNALQQRWSAWHLRRLTAQFDFFDFTTHCYYYLVEIVRSFETERKHVN